MDFFWDLYQQHDITRLKAKASHTEGKVRSANATVAQLESRVDQLVLLNHALWELIAESAELTQQDLADKVKEIDLRDGVEDGKVRQIQKCPDCDRTMSRRHARCLYCGAEAVDCSPLDKL